MSMFNDIVWGEKMNSSVSTDQSQTCAMKWNREICESLVIPTEIANTNTTSQSSQSSQGNLLQEYFKKFGDLLEDQKLSKLCKDAGFLTKIEKGQLFISIEEGSEIVQTACREYIQSRHLETSRPRGWILSNTKIKIGPVLGETLSSRRTLLH